MTPYEAMRGRKPSMRHLGVWGCDAFVHLPKEQRSALAAKVEPGIYLGHDEAQNAATIYVLRTRKVIISRDVTYRSSSFMHMRAVRLGEEQVADILSGEDCSLQAEVQPDSGGARTAK